MLDLLAAPRGKGFKCLHGTDADGYTKRLKGWKPPKERRKQSGNGMLSKDNIWQQANRQCNVLFTLTMDVTAYVDIWKRRKPRQLHKRDRFFRARIRARKQLVLQAAANGVLLEPPSWQVRYEKDQELKARELRDRSG